MAINRAVEVAEAVRRALGGREELQVCSQVEALALISLIVLQAGCMDLGTRTTMSTAAECEFGDHGMRAEISLVDRHGHVRGSIGIK